MYEVADDYLIGKAEYQRLLDHDAALRAEVERLTQDNQIVRKALLASCSDQREYLECKPSCDSYGHDEGCEVANPGLAFKRLETSLAQAQAELKNWKRFYTNVIDPLLSGLILGQAKLDFFQGWAKSVQREAVQEAQRGGARESLPSCRSESTDPPTGDTTS